MIQRSVNLLMVRSGKLSTLLASNMHHIPFPSFGILVIFSLQTTQERKKMEKQKQKKKVYEYPEDPKWVGRRPYADPSRRKRCLKTSQRIIEYEFEYLEDECRLVAQIAWGRGLGTGHARHSSWSAFTLPKYSSALRKYSFHLLKIFSSLVSFFPLFWHAIRPAQQCLSLPGQ